ncbi:MAG: putative Fe-S cluster assembly protein SufT [Deltaproteobacteria bacterium]|nr:putative Fe-S cluster assembly protein SufT [Deltaproteobacteria bacterium]
MKRDEPTKLRRDCEATLIPTGEKVNSPAGRQVWVTQLLGGSFTAMTERGSMVRIGGKDADALGLSPAPSPPGATTAPEESPANIEQRIWDQLKTCFDPEIPVNIVDLGLVYQCHVISLKDGGNKVEVRFTLTARGCGMGEVLKVDIRNKILGIPGVKEVDVELVWDPPWNQTMISGAAKQQLGMV